MVTQKPYVYISYNPTSISVASILKQLLQEQNINCYMPSYDEYTNDAIYNCSCFISFLDDYFQSSRVKQENQRAHCYAKKCILMDYRDELILSNEIIEIIKQSLNEPTSTNKAIEYKYTLFEIQDKYQVYVNALYNDQNKETEELSEARSMLDNCIHDLITIIKNINIHSSIERNIARRCVKVVGAYEEQSIAYIEYISYTGSNKEEQLQLYNDLKDSTNNLKEIINNVIDTFYKTNTDML